MTTESHSGNCGCIYCWVVAERDAALARAEAAEAAESGLVAIRDALQRESKKHREEMEHYRTCWHGALESLNTAERERDALAVRLDAAMQAEVERNSAVAALFAALSRQRRVLDLAETAWGIIANAGGGDWTKESATWQEAAARWRDEYHRALAAELEAK